MVKVQITVDEQKSGEGANNCSFLFTQTLTNYFKNILVSICIKIVKTLFSTKKRNKQQKTTTYASVLFSIENCDIHTVSQYV